jgi:hypothetical protein
MGTKVWYDDYSMEVGDSLTENINLGIKECGKCILILTPNFLSKGGWPKREFQMAFTKEMVESRNLILPVWSGVSHGEVYEYNISLSDKIGLNLDVLGLNRVVHKLAAKLLRT